MIKKEMMTMPKQTIIIDPKGQLFYHEETGIVHHYWTAQLDSELLRKTLSTGVELLKKHGAKKWLSDNRFIKPHSEEDEHWINTVWLPDALNAGWKYWSLIVPEEELSRINMINFVEEFYAKGVRVMIFTDPSAALKWLETVS